jgi:hypothetical protein
MVTPQRGQIGGRLSSSTPWSIPGSEESDGVPVGRHATGLGQCSGMTPEERAGSVRIAELRRTLDA